MNAYDDRPPMDVDFAPQGRSPQIPVEVLLRSQLLARISTRELTSKQRVGFHQLVLCTSGSGVHEVDFEQIPFEVGTLLRIHPGQVQRFLPEHDFEAIMVIWPIEAHHADPAAPAWYPGSSVPTRWDLDDELQRQISGWIDELDAEQRRYRNTSTHRSLMQALLCALLMRLAIEVPSSSPTGTRLPQAYLDYRRKIEESLYERPTVVSLAKELGYSTRTLDRACTQVTGHTARDVLDDRIALEVRRLLTHTDRPLARISTQLGFNDPSNFSKFVKRNLGDVPSVIREQR